MKEVHYYPHVIGKETESRRNSMLNVITSKWSQDSSSGGLIAELILSNIYILCLIANKSWADKINILSHRMQNDSDTFQRMSYI